jgi:signal transduction histidine kinase
VVLAASALCAIWLDPTQPAKNEGATYALMIVYVVYSLLLAGLVWSSSVPLAGLRLATHGIDLAIFSVFIHLTDGPPSSPFFVYFVFSVVCATLRWSWPGTLATVAISLGILIAMGVYQAALVQDEQANRFIIRSVYLAVIAVLLGYTAAYERQLRSEVGKLAAWPAGALTELREIVRQVLAHAAGIIGAPRLAMVWEEVEEPWLHVAIWAGGDMQWSREPAPAATPHVARPLEDTAFLCRDARAVPATVLHTTGRGLARWHGAPIAPELAARLAASSVLSLRLKGDDWSGRLFFLDKRRLTSDDLTLGQIVAQQAVARLDHYYLLRRLQHAAVLGERGRLARDLHDGLLQTLTGTALQLETLRRLLDGASRSALERLEEVQRLIIAQQRCLRAFIRELRPAGLLPSGSAAGFGAGLRELCERVARQWGLVVTVDVAGEPPDVPGPLAGDITYIVHEALANAARHGQARAARVHVRFEGSEATIAVSDDGQGFPFQGRYALSTLVERGCGPSSLKERVADRAGDLCVDSTSTGSRVEVRLPVAAAEA